ncbi:FAD-binding oxidoreductase [Spongisporangium articulatum]|uniref:FAD-binding oxidoreductase n=1 Tax=Spongisporangium articulatum TaxID=3362603 RepID=A0ABW8AV91_9ACTN
MTHLDDVTRLLAPALGERLLTPERTGFDELSAPALAAPGVRPAVLARPRDTAEVASVVRAAAETGAPLAVRSGGHSYARFGTADAGLVLDVRLLDHVEVSPATRVATAGGGVPAGAYTAAAAEHGLATGFGDTSTVGVSGITLGGGIGYLSRRDGLTVDNLLAAEVVLADGRTVRADEHEHPELFWALRGGGGNFGVVTHLELRLHPTPTVTGGALAFEPRPETVEALVSAARVAPDELSLMVNVMKAPPAPFLPAERHGTPIVVALVCHSGRPEDADAALAPLRAAGPLLADVVRPQPYPGLLRAEEPGLQASIRTGFADTFDAARAARAIELVGSAPTPVAVVNLRPMGGAISRIPPEATAFAHRGHALMESVSAVDLPGRDPAPVRDWVAGAAEALTVGRGPGYVNFLEQTGPDVVHRAYPDATLRRLAAVKAAYDPQNLFRANHTVLPAQA